MGVVETGRRGHGASEDMTTSHKEKDANANHTQITSKRTHTHTPAVDEDDGKQVIDQAKPDTIKKGLAATPKHKVRHEGRGERKHTETKGVL